MQKTLDILEKNVQWIVLGLAALFLLWTAYAYLLTPPATIKINGHLATPGEVSLEVQTTAKDLERQIKENKPVSFPTPDLVTDWQRHITNPFGRELLAGNFSSLPDLKGIIDKGPTGTEGPRIATLPTAPAPQILPLTVGLSTVMPQSPNPPQGQIGGAAPVQPVVQPQRRDTAWITVPAMIPAKVLADALLAPFHGARLNPAIGGLYNTTLLQVVLERQQSNGANASGVATFPADDKTDIIVVQPLLADQPFIQKLPAASASMDARYQYINWAQQNQALLITPGFYQVLNGDPWQPPQLPPPAATDNGAAPGAPGVAPAPAAPVPAAPAPVAPATPPPSRTTAAPAPQSNAAILRGSSTFFFQFDPFHPPPPAAGFRRGAGNPPPGFNPPPPPPGQPFNGNNANNGNGIINPFNLNTDILMWAIDETAKPGQTYRYRVRYVMKNPVFAVQNMAPPELASVLSISSPPSAWSDPIKAPAVTKFWVAGLPQKDRAALDVFQYQDGTWKLTKPVVLPGDQLPGTDLTMVDVRSTEASHGRDRYVLLTSDTGDMIRRDVTQDESDPDHKAMMEPANPNQPNPGQPNRGAGPGRDPYGPGRGLRPPPARFPNSR